MRATKRLFRFSQNLEVISNDPLSRMRRSLEKLRDQAGTLHIQIKHLWQRHEATRHSANDAARALAVRQSVIILKRTLSRLESE